MFVMDLFQFSQLSVEFLIQWVYNNQDLDKKIFKDVDIREFMELLDFIGLDCIQDLFIESICKLVSDAAWNKWYMFADQLGFKKLKSVILTCMGHDIKNVIKSEHFTSLSYETFE